MAKVKLSKDMKIGSMPQTWSLYRIGTGPGRAEGQGFESIKEAEEFAKKYGHEITERENSNVDIANSMFNALGFMRVSKGKKKYGTVK